jgi:hypothetical protein
MTEEKRTDTADAASVKASLAVIADEVGRLLRRVAPSAEAQAHFRLAHVECLKGIRKVIDERIDGLSKAHEQGTSIRVE